jgi:primase-polymerase (primpol)-like protein
MPKVKKTKPLRSPAKALSPAEQSRMLMKLLQAPLKIPRGAKLAVRKEPSGRSEAPSSSQFDFVPAELRALKQWVGWGKSFDAANPKRPIRVCPGQRFIKATIGNTEHWTTFEAACAAVGTHGIEGIGFHFDANDPYVGIDLDHCIVDGAISSAAQEIVDSLPECYWEISQSGTGLHAIGKGRKPGPNCKAVNPEPGIAAIEIYEKERHFCTTGNQIGSVKTIGDIQDKLIASTTHCGPMCEHKKQRHQLSLPASREATKN